MSAALYASIDLCLLLCMPPLIGDRKNVYVYLLKNRCIIAQKKPYKNTIKYSLPFPCLFVLFGGELPFL